MKFFGLDLGWTTGATGLSCLGWQNGELNSIELGHLIDLDEILQWIDDRLDSGECAVVAVDAPTVISNATGMRDCDRLAHKYFGRYHAGCYPANLGRPFAQRTLLVGRRLEERGFQHAPELEVPMSTGRYQLEVFPHAVMLHLFQLDRILKYKKGRLAERRLELNRLRQLMVTTFPTLVPSFAPSIELSTLLPDIPHKGREMKIVEDQLDSLICAYTAAHWWYWGNQKNWVLGDRSNGYIVVPTPFGPIGVN
ncbi:MAG: DUF429 domain-containing protein [Merismopedia sp. SIO2A8]|nr:DUF429 domain-containing protein [Symploca sp. SIO2B6]NET48933.1 DUF429 domain-containing protein [Merismopedia sp. SIO2A8]